MVTLTAWDLGGNLIHAAVLRGVVSLDKNPMPAIMAAIVLRVLIIVRNWILKPLYRIKII
jgi:hypothetical protein